MEIKSVNNGYKYIFKNGNWKDVLGETPNKKLQKEFIKILREIPYRDSNGKLKSDDSFHSYYFETPNIILPNSPIEFVLIKSNSLHKRKATWKPYEEHMNRKPYKLHSLSFDNLSRSTRLIVPYNKKDSIRYGHLKDFMLTATTEEIEDILSKVGEEIEEYRDKYTNPLYLSTHGDGVSWLHFRIEKVPKYYSYKPYTKT